MHMAFMDIKTGCVVSTRQGKQLPNGHRQRVKMEVQMGTGILRHTVQKPTGQMLPARVVLCAK